MSWTSITAVISITAESRHGPEGTGDVGGSCGFVLAVGIKACHKRLACGVLS